MCGIWCFCGPESYNAKDIEWCVEYIKNRGPESTAYALDSPTHGFAFTRLAINGLKQPTHAMQPFTAGDLQWMCNGEIYNHSFLETRHSLNVTPEGSDCEVIGHLYTALGSDAIATARALDGVFAFAMYNSATQELILARDPYGVRPLYYGFIGATIFAASEMKALPTACERVAAFPPGHVGVFTVATGLTLSQYHAIPWVKNPTYEDYSLAATALKTSLEAAVQKRLMTERPCAALLSGGLDSSLIAALVQKQLKAQGKPALETYSIGFAGSSDLYYARRVADYIGSTHHEIVSTPEEFFAAIPQVITTIESPDITSIRASVGNWLVAKYIRDHSPSGAKVVFNGDGSDEVFGSYLYFYNAPSDDAFEMEVDRLLKDIHHFDVLRSDRCISSNGLEPRTPFLDKQFVSVARSVATKWLRPIKTERPEKWLLRTAFEESGLLPHEVLWRRKEAFSDGVSGVEKSWYEEVQERVASQGLTLSSAEQLLKLYPALTPTTLEAYYYRVIYSARYKHVVVPYYWLPRWCGGATDPSARTLKVYNS